MLHLEIAVPTALSDDVVELLSDQPTISALTRHTGAALKPKGDVITADIARESVNDVVRDLALLGVQDHGTLRIGRVETWFSRDGLAAELAAPGASSDAVVWTEVTQRAYDDTEINWTMATFMTMATLLAAIAIVLDSQILTIGAMVLGPEFGAIAALGLALVRHRRGLFTRALRALAVGFSVAILITIAASLLGRALGWVTRADVVSGRPATDFIYHPDKWSFIVAVIAAAAGVLSLTSSKVGGLSGVFISVTTIPAAGNMALAAAFGVWGEVRGSALQLLINVTGMAIAGWVTLVIQQRVWARISARVNRSGRVTPHAAWKSDLPDGLYGPKH